MEILGRRVRRPVRLGSLRRTAPVSDRWGFDRGLPVDRYYIERFLERHRGDIRGACLEVGTDRYTRLFDAGVTSVDVLDVDSSNGHATIVADLADARGVEADRFDCILLTQTLQYIYDAASAIRETHRLLRPGGVLLATVPAVSKVDAHAGVAGDHWRFTYASCSRLFGDAFGLEHVTVKAHGNVLAAIAFLEGLAREDLSDRELDVEDELFPVLITVRAVKREP
jgi:SAM-dependent methyltransferase